MIFQVSRYYPAFIIYPTKDNTRRVPVLVSVALMANLISQLLQNKISQVSVRYRKHTTQKWPFTKRTRQISPFFSYFVVFCQINKNLGFSTLGTQAVFIILIVHKEIGMSFWVSKMVPGMRVRSPDTTSVCFAFSDLFVHCTPQLCTCDSVAIVRVTFIIFFK